VTTELTHGTSKLPCPCCQKPMLSAKVPKRVMAFRCDDCFGAWIDGFAVRMMIRRELPSSVVKPRGDIGFICAACGEKFPFAQGNASKKGLICKGCVVNPRPGRIPKGQPTGWGITPGPRRGTDFALEETIGSISLLFEDD
jgi:hypothetical protein